MAGEAVHYRRGTAIAGDFGHVILIDRLHHREHQPRRVLLFLVVEIPFAGDMTEAAADAK